jgi:hypothetical protein
MNTHQGKEVKPMFLSTSENVESDAKGTRPKGAAINSDIFDGPQNIINWADVVPDPGDFVYCRESGTVKEFSWFAHLIRVRKQRDEDRAHVFLVCDRCGNRREGRGLELRTGAVCQRCRRTKRVEVAPHVFQSQPDESFFREMTEEEKTRFIRDREIWQGKIREKETAAKKIRETASKAQQGAGGMYSMPVPYFPETLPEEKKKKKK